ncbi:MAG: rod shape-determining protein MreD [Rhodoferax ferrireducens]|uniref:Rod shape-determining protein MreD n=2 Tax=Pseudomonadota TaxID=1224 RepID=A0A1Y1R0E8_9GAMM|nr:MAG: rod shape-determining protein MreD [Rhodoferax ferrireducens]OQX17295.1 MAG: rod shape-determining protein MreD [Thiothrix lacustris]
MIMRPGQQLLLPANPWFIWSSLLTALALNMLQNMGLWGRAAWSPDLVAVALVFWAIHQPLRVGVGSAFLLGLAMDVHQSALLGQHALAYSALSFLAIGIHRRILWFSVPSQTAQVLPLFAAAHALTLALRLLSGDVFPGWSVVLAPVVEALLWPVVSVLLLLPQRQAPDRDENRPL